MKAEFTVLLVEDNLTDAFIAERMIKYAYPHLHLVHQENGERALDYLKRNKKPDLIILDLRMPVMDGFEFLKVVKKLPSLDDIPVTVLSSSSNGFDYSRCQKLQVRSYLTKPLSDDQISTLLPWVDKEQVTG